MEPAKNIVYDFYEENLPLLVIAGFTLIKSRLSLYALNVTFLAVIYFLFFVTFVMSIITVIVAQEQKAVMGQALFTIGTICVGVGLTAANHLQRKNLRRALKLIRDGIYHYSEGINEEYEDILRKRIREMKFVISFFIKMFSCCGFGYIAVFPVLKVFLVTEEETDSSINPYLPIPLYLPFDTSSSWAFSLVFLVNGVTLSCMYASYASHIQIYVTCALQLTAEYEILNHSLENIERRAYFQLKNQDIVHCKNASVNYSLYEKPEFQKCLLNCLRENILHHHAILR